MTLLRLSLLALGVLLGVASSAAQTRPVQLALFNPVQIFPESESIAGVRLSLIYGSNAGVSGLDLGLVNKTGGGGFTGIQWGFVALTEGNVTGLQWNFVGLAKGNVEGVQIGFYNSASHCSGLQLGFINNTGTMKGLQIGLVNIIDRGGQFPVFPIVNWSF